MPPEAPTLLVGPGNSWGAAPQCALVPPPRPGPRPARPARATSSRWYHKAIPNLGCPGTNSPSRPLPRGHTPLEPHQEDTSSLPGVRAATQGQLPAVFFSFFFFSPRKGRESQPGRLRPGQGSVRRRTPEPTPSPSPPHLPSSCSQLLLPLLKRDPLPLCCVTSGTSLMLSEL